jgi:hypothetical protein
VAEAGHAAGVLPMNPQIRERLIAKQKRIANQSELT